MLDHFVVVSDYKSRHVTFLWKNCWVLDGERQVCMLQSATNTNDAFVIYKGV